MSPLNETHDPERESWVEAAAPGLSDFPIQNLPFCRFVIGGEGDGDERGGMAIGDRIVDLGGLLAEGLLEGAAALAGQAAAGGPLNGLMALGAGPASALRARVSQLLRKDGTDAARLQAGASRWLVPMARAQMRLPAVIQDYTDFLTSRHHTERHGRFKGLKDPLPPAFFSLPVAYHGRASSIRVSGTAVTRPNGQFRDAAGELRFGPAVALDYELELGAFVGPGNELASPIPLRDAPRHLFGYCLLNDWSAKDIQWWEQVLGPFLGKSFMTSISPWVVTAEAMAPFQAPAAPRAEADPPLMSHLYSAQDQAAGALDVTMESWLRTAAMRERAEPGVRLSRANPRQLYWTFAQMLTHHASNGCNLRPGDLLGSGTVSGVEPESMSCLTEIAEAGRKPLALSAHESRRWLEDGDEIVLRARAEREGFVPIGFGECRGVVLPARPWPHESSESRAVDSVSDDTRGNP